MMKLLINRDGGRECAARRVSSAAQVWLAAVVLLGCESGVERSAAPGRGSVPPVDVPRDWRPFASAALGFSAWYPPDWRVERFHAGQPLEVVNIVPAALPPEIQLPLEVHAEPEASFVSIFPRGYGTEVPAGGSASLSAALPELELGFAVDRASSQALLLESGAVWGLIVYPSAPPSSWSERAFVFAQIAVRDFRAECFGGETGEPLSMEQCDPLLGDDFRRHGRLDRRAREVIVGILESIRLEAALAE